MLVFLWYISFWGSPEIAQNNYHKNMFSLLSKIQKVLILFLINLIYSVFIFCLFLMLNKTKFQVEAREKSKCSK